MTLFQQYVDFLCRPRVWGFAAKSGEGMPVSSPHISHVLQYDRAIRKTVATKLNQGMDFKSALESAIANDDCRTLNFVTPFSIDAKDKKSLDLTAPGLSEMYPDMIKSSQSRGEKRPADMESWDAPMSKQQMRKAGKAAAKSAAAKQASAATAAAAKAAARAKAKGTPKGGKAKGKGKGVLPAGANSSTADGKPICFAFCLGQACRTSPCTFARVCWFCAGSHAGKDRV